MKNRTFIFMAICFAQFSIAQPKRLCGDALYKEQLSQQYPGFKQSYEKTLQQISDQVERNKTSRGTSTQYTVNVVVHVVWKDSAENLDDSIILSQIQVLNEDYNRLNADTFKLRHSFKPIAGNANIHFNLFQIIRKHTDTLFKVDLFSGGISNKMKYDSLGGSSAIDPVHYLNIWVCKIQPLMIGNVVLGQILGFAYPPNNLSNWPSNSGAPNAGEDGVVIDYRAFGRNNPNILTIGTQTITVKGRTPVHEVGHYLGLRHIWGDGATFGSNNCQGNDGIQDTPNADNQSNFDCDTTKNTCVDTNLGWTTLDMPDLIENYMDYSDDGCMNMFSQGQVSWMRTTLEGPRSGLLTSVKENQQLIKLHIYPNPSKGRITIQAPLLINHATIKIQDIAGKVIYEQEHALNYGKLNINIDDLNKGVYILTLSNNDTRSIEKVVVE